MVYVLMVVIFFCFLCALRLGKEVREHKEIIQIVESLREVTSEQVKFLRRMTFFFRFLEIAMWFLVGILTTVILKHFNS